MRHGVKLSELPHLNAAALSSGRRLFLCPLWDGTRWRMWVQANDVLVEISPVDVAKIDYAAREPARQDDIHLRFVNAVYQHLSSDAVIPPMRAIGDDLQNLAAACGKLEFFWLQRHEVGSCLNDFVITETEYILTVTRGILDHLQEILSGLWRFTTFGPNREVLKKLPKTIHEVVFDRKKDRPRTGEELHDLFQLTPSLVAFYVAYTPFILSLGHLRNEIVHRGQQGGPVFITERGYGVAVGGRLYELAAAAWKPEHKFNDRVVSLKPLLSHAIATTLEACEAGIEAYVTNTELPPPLMPGLSIFTRLAQATALARVLGVRRGGEPWWDAVGEAFERDAEPRSRTTEPAGVAS